LSISAEMGTSELVLCNRGVLASTITVYAAGMLLTTCSAMPILVYVHTSHFPTYFCIAKMYRAVMTIDAPTVMKIGI